MRIDVLSLFLNAIVALAMLVPGFMDIADAQSPPASRIRGRVTNAGTGAPLKLAYVSVTPQAGGAAVATFTTNDRGVFAGAVAPGTYELVITYMLFPEKRVPNVIVNPGEETTVEAALNSRPEVTVTGFVYEPQGTAETPISGVNVAFKPTAGPTDRIYGAVTGADGRFSLSLPTGTYEVSVLAVFYRKKVIPRLLVSRTRPPSIRVSMEPEAVQMKEVVVEGNAIRNTNKAELSIRRKDAVVTDAVSRQAIDRSTDSDAGQVLNRVTGISTKDGKYLVVRGLSERYTSTQLNGARIGSPEPNRKIVPLDIFPAGLLDGITVQKAYSPDQPGEFGGGVVKIQTRDIPEKPVWAQSMSLGYTPGTTGDAGLGYKGGGLDFLGIDQVRDLPDLIKEKASNTTLYQKSPLRPNEGGFTKEELLQFAQSFKDQWAPRKYTPGANSGLSETFGRRFDLFGKPLGVMGSFSWSRAAETTTGERNFYEDDSLSIKGDYDEFKTTQSVLWGGTGTLTYRLGRGTTFRGSLFYSRSSDDEARRYEGYNKDYDRPFRSERLMYIQRHITAGTFGAEHVLPLPGATFEWKLNRSEAARDEPDRRENAYEQNDLKTSAGTDTLVWVFSRIGASRLFSGLADREKGYEVHLTFPFHTWAEGDARFKIGAADQRKNRTSWTRRFTFVTSTGVNTLPIDQLLSDENLGSVTFRETTRGTDFYWAEQKVNAWYFLFDVPIMKRLRMLAGSRFEKATQSITDYGGAAFKSDKTTYGNDKHDAMPALNFTYALGGNTNLRFAASQTVIRPDLRELTNFDLTNYVGGGPETGNPKLKRSLIQSCDLRWETFPTPGSLIAVSAFYKKLHDPIEKTIQGGEAPRVFPNNGLDGRNRGIELELRGGLGGVFWHTLDRFGISTNLTLLSTQVELPKSGVQTASTRPLEGQSKYVTNVGLFYTSEAGNVELSLFGNSYGRRLTGVGVYGQPDIYERSRTTIDGTAGFRVNHTFRLKFSAKNLSDAPIVVEQGTKIREKRSPGASYSLGLTIGS